MQELGRERGPARWVARVLAPIALVAVALVIIWIVGGAFDDSDDGGGSEDRTAQSGCNPEADAAVENGFYVIKPGEGLGVVEDRTCVSLDRLTRLNPELDTQTISVGACVNLRPDGCEAAG